MTFDDGKTTIVLWSTNDDDGRRKLLYPISKTTNFCGSSVFNNHHRRRPMVNWVNFLFMTNNNTSSTMMTACSRNCVIDPKRNDEQGQTLNELEDFNKSSPENLRHYPKNSSVMNYYRPLPLFSLVIICFLLSFLFTPSFGALLQLEPLQPVNVTIKPVSFIFKPPGSQYKRFQDGQTSRVIVEIVLNISEATPVGTPISYLQAYDKVPGDLTGTNYT